MISLDVVFSNEIAEMKEKLGRMEVSMYSFGSSIHDKVEAELKELKTKMNNSGDFVVVNTRDEQILTDIQVLKDENKLLKKTIVELMENLMNHHFRMNSPTGGYSGPLFDMIYNKGESTSSKIKEILKQL